MEKRRNYKIDNIKAFLIFLVVLAHNMEPFYKGSIRVAYLFIYLFHMPLFILCTGYFAKFRVSRIKNKILYPYIIFQAAYLLFEILYYKESDYPYTLFSPYWILWYLFSFFFWMMLLPFIEPFCKKKKTGFLAILLSIFIGILVGFDKQIGMEYSLSRTIVFLPFFLCGYLMRRFREWDLLNQEYSTKTKQKNIALFLIIVLFFVFIQGGLRPKIVYGAYCYEECGGSWYMRLLLYCIAFLMSICVIIWMPSKRSIFSYLGQNSMQIFLLHGFVIKILRKIDIYQYLKGEIVEWIFLLASTVVLVLALGSSWVKKLMLPLIECPIEKYRKKMQEKREQNIRKGRERQRKEE